jgi:hypothetical protein
MAAQDIYDFVVASSGGHVTTIQEADNLSGSNGFTAFVKSETHAGFTIASGTDDVYIFFEPDTVINSAITLAGDRIHLFFSAGCDVQAGITISGDDCSIVCENGCLFDELTITGQRPMIDGGGHGTKLEGETRITSVDDFIIKNLSIDTKTAGNNDYCIIYAATCDRCNTINVNVIDSDSDSLVVSGGSSSEHLFYGCTIQNSDSEGMRINGARHRVIGNSIRNCGDEPIDLSNSSDDSIIFGNLVEGQDAGIDGILIDAGAENCVVVSNRVDDLGTGNGINDASGTSTVALNDETAF